jgi:hypothetical protein
MENVDLHHSANAPTSIVDNLINSTVEVVYLYKLKQ